MFFWSNEPPSEWNGLKLAGLATCWFGNIGFGPFKLAWRSPFSRIIRIFQLDLFLQIQPRGPPTSYKWSHGVPISRVKLNPVTSLCSAIYMDTGRCPPWLVVFRFSSRFSRWWFQTFFIFTPIWGRWPHFDDHIFQMGGKKTTNQRNIHYIHFQKKGGFFISPMTGSMGWEYLPIQSHGSG